jgi:archaemetzincin
MTDTSNPRRSPFTLAGLLLIVAILCLSVALLVPVLRAARESANRAACAGNLSQWYRGMHVYFSSFGENRLFVPHVGDAFWTCLVGHPGPEHPASYQQKAPFRGSRDLFVCPGSGSDESSVAPGGPMADYRGPARHPDVPPGVLSALVGGIPAETVIACDEEGNHEGGGNVLQFDGAVMSRAEPDFSNALSQCIHSPSDAVDGADFPRKAPPRPGDWLSVRPEKGQSVAEYKRECANRRREGRETIVVQPLGDILKRNADVIESVREYCAIFYGCPAETAGAIGMPAGSYVGSREQYNADRILEALEKRAPAKALAYIGFCGEDLYHGGLNFVFGVAGLGSGTGVYSLARYGDKDARENGEPVFLKRSLKVASHELGHMLGMLHCVRYECCLNGSNSIREMDGRPMHLCPECLEKARWNTGFDVAGRYRKLAEFYDRAGLRNEADFARRQAQKAAAKASGL